jgi:SAM-dependent methyltransferase
MHADPYADWGVRLIAGGLEVPDLRPHFKHLHWRPMPHSMGVPVASDFADRAASDPVFGLYKNCGLWTQDEAAILYNVAAAVRGRWLDLGCHTGWTAAHQAAAGCDVVAVDNMLPVFPFYARFQENVAAWDIDAFAGTTQEFFEWVSPDARFSGVVIDADHEHPWPLKDAQKAVEHLEDSGVILFHDFIGRPVRTAVEYLMSRGFNCRVYWTAHMVACCWRGEFVPPQHQPLPGIDLQRVKESMRDFAFDRCQ